MRLKACLQALSHGGRAPQLQALARAPRSPLAGPQTLRQTLQGLSQTPALALTLPHVHYQGPQLVQGRKAL